MAPFAAVLAAELVIEQTGAGLNMHAPTAYGRAPV